MFPMVSGCCHNSLIHVEAPRVTKTQLSFYPLLNTCLPFWHAGFLDHGHLLEPTHKNSTKEGSYTRLSRWWKSPRGTKSSSQGCSPCPLWDCALSIWYPKRVCTLSLLKRWASKYYNLGTRKKINWHKKGRKWMHIFSWEGWLGIRASFISMS